ncbi:MAG: hypothetical protein Ta2A_09590 [Treponemataceae bacterium]|nr:MAG: hypothetical protein Ta2A_09590 [Treponemataceae bacterium]
MEITTKQLKTRPSRIIAQVNNGQEITITCRGKACAKIVPVSDKHATKEETDSELFGMWKDREDLGDIDQYVRNMRKGKKLC